MIPTRQPENPFLSTAQAAGHLNMPEATLRYWRAVGIGPAYYKFGRNVRYSAADILAYQEQHRHQPSVQAVLEAKHHGSL